MTKTELEEHIRSIASDGKVDGRAAFAPLYRSRSALTTTLQFVFGHKAGFELKRLTRQKGRAGGCAQIHITLPMNVALAGVPEVLHRYSISQRLHESRTVKRNALVGLPPEPEVELELELSVGDEPEDGVELQLEVGEDEPGTALAPLTVSDLVLVEAVERISHHVLAARLGVRADSARRRHESLTTKSAQYRALGEAPLSVGPQATAGGVQTVQHLMLNEEQALVVSQGFETETAIGVRIAMAKVFAAFRAGRLQPTASEPMNMLLSGMALLVTSMNTFNARLEAIEAKSAKVPPPPPTTKALPVQIKEVPVIIEKMFDLKLPAGWRSSTSIDAACPARRSGYCVLDGVRTAFSADVYFGGGVVVRAHAERTKTLFSKKAGSILGACSVADAWIAENLELA